MNAILVSTIVLFIVTFANGQNEVPLTIDEPVPVLLRSEVRDDAGQYSLSYRTADGLGHSEQGLLKRNSEGTGNVLVKQGSYTYISPDGKPITVTYVADENGFQPVGTHLPQQVQPQPIS